MKVLFVYPGQESLGVESLSAVLRREGHRTQLAFDPVLFDDSFFFQPQLAGWLDAGPRIAAQARAFGPDLVAVAILSPFWRWAQRRVAELREVTGAPVVIGGPHVSGAPEAALRGTGADFAIVGEGEGPLAALVAALDGRGAMEHVPNLLRWQNGTITRHALGPFTDVRALPWADKDLYAGAGPQFRIGYTIATSRGCAMRCSFCSESLFSGLSEAGDSGFLRRRSVEDVIAELKAAKRSRGFDHVRFYDPIFAFDRRWLEAFAEAYAAEVGVPYWCLAYPSMLDARTVEALARSGCFEIQMGIQDLNPDTRRQVFGRVETNADVAAAIRRVRDAGIHLAVDNILGTPGQTPQDVLDAVDFYEDAAPDRLNVYWLTYFPGTTILPTAVEAGDLTDEAVKTLEEDPTMRAFHINRPAHRGDLHRLFTWLQFSQVLPASARETVKRHRLWRFFPKSAGPLPTLLAYQARSVRRFAHLESRVTARYRHYGPKLAAARLGR